MSATDELRRLLDERGVVYRWDNGTATWYVDGVMYNAWGYDDERLTMSVCHLTPEQAVEATLGRGECSNKAIRPQTFWCDQCDCAAEGWVDVGGTLINGFRYCPNCGRKVVDA